MNDTIRFENGATYERHMGHWSQLAGMLEFARLPLRAAAA